MSLVNKIEEDFKVALKGKQEVEVEALRLIKAVILNKVKEAGKESSDDEVVMLLRGLVKKHKDSIDAYGQAGRTDLVLREQQQMAVVTRYLPEQLSLEQTREEVKKIFDAMNEAEKANLGVIMGQVMSQLKGKADGGVVNQVVKELLGQ